VTAPIRDGAARPRVIGVAVVLTVVSGALDIAYRARVLTNDGTLAEVLALILAVLIVGYVLWRLWHGDNRARWVLLVLTLLGFLGDPPLTGDQGSAQTPVVVQVLVTVLLVAALVLLFVPTSNAWFRGTMRAPRRSSETIR
jgi:hypothetical protein